MALVGVEKRTFSTPNTGSFRAECGSDARCETFSNLSKCYGDATLRCVRSRTTIDTGVTSNVVVIFELNTIRGSESSLRVVSSGLRITFGKYSDKVTLWTQDGGKRLRRIIQKYATEVFPNARRSLRVTSRLRRRLHRREMQVTHTLRG